MLVRTEIEKALHSVNTVKLIEVIQIVTSPLQKYTHILIKNSFSKIAIISYLFFYSQGFFFKTSTVKREKNIFFCSDKNIQKDRNKLLAIKV